MLSMVVQMLVQVTVEGPYGNGLEGKIFLKVIDVLLLIHNWNLFLAEKVLELFSLEWCLEEKVVQETIFQEFMLELKNIYHGYLKLLEMTDANETQYLSILTCFIGIIFRGK